MSMSIQGRPPPPEQEALAKASAEHWRKVINEAPAQALARAEDAARQLVALTGTLQGLYFAVFAFSDLRARVPNALIQLLFLAPLALWLASLYCATRVFVPQPRPESDLSNEAINAWQAVRETYFNAGRDKLTWLHRAHTLLVVSFAAVLLLIVSLVFVPGAPAAGATQIIILTPTSAVPGTTPTP